MKNTIGLAVLAVVAIGLAVTLFITKRNADDQNSKAQDKIVALSNSWESTSLKLAEQISVNATLEKDKATLEKDKATLTQEKSELAGQLTVTKSTLASTEKALADNKQELAKANSRITDLENANAQLDQQAASLSLSLSNLTDQITVTRQKLATSEGNREFLEKELARLMAEKAELERQFNDIAVLKAQVAKLREELNISRRLEWLRKGLTSPTKGAQGLIQSGPTASPAPTSQTSTSRYDLNVEVQSDGSVRVLPVPGPSTNVPALPK